MIVALVKLLLMHFLVQKWRISNALCGTRFLKWRNFKDFTMREFPSREKTKYIYSSMFDTPHYMTKEILFKPEVLSPAGGWEQLMAACANGADAVYFGLQEGFNARARANNFAIDEIENVMEYLHDRGVKGYVVVNILVFDEEMEKLEPLILRLAHAGVDALIMQDIGAVKLVRQVAPHLPIHGSTQMSITDAHGADFASRQLGVDRVVVGRELSIKEIHSVASQSDAEVEAFVHGALCVSYSGQCFSSEAWGGRSANRGQCAQACRMPYGLVVNGTLQDLHDVKYLLSPQDLMALDYVPDLIEAGVRSFKIEGRLKGPEYVAITTRAYREAVDEAWRVLHGNRSEVFHGPDEAMRRNLKQVFSRGQDEDFDGLSAGFLKGVQHQSLVRGRNPRHRGILVGRVRAVAPRGVTVELCGPIKRGDGVVFDGGEPEEREQGGAVYEVCESGATKALPKGEERSQGTVRLSFGRGTVDPSRVKVGDLVWKNKDSELDLQLRKYLDQSTNLRKVGAVSVKLAGAVGRPLEMTLTCSLADGRTLRATAATASSLSFARTRPLSEEDLLHAIGALGDTPFAMAQQALDLQELPLQQGIFVPLTELKAARRAAMHRLLQSLRVHGRAEGLPQHGRSVWPQLRHDAARSAAAEEVEDVEEATKSEPLLSLLCRSPQQVAAACAVTWLDEVVLDFLEIHGLRESVEAVRRAGKTVIVATPRIIKPEEERLFTFYVRLRPDALLVRSAGFLQQLMDMGGPGALYNTRGPQSVDKEPLRIPALHGDFSLNAANILSAGLLLQSGLTRLAPTHDLNAQQIASLATSLQDFEFNGDSTFSTSLSRL